MQKTGRGRGDQAGPTTSRFQPLNVQADANGAAALEAAPADDSADVTRLLPPGFTIQTAQDAIALNGSRDATTLDRGLMNDRVQAIRLGEFDPVTGQFAGGFGSQGGPGPGGAGDVAAPGDRGFGGPGGGRGGGRGGFVLGGRGARAQSAYQGSATYTFGGLSSARRTVVAWQAAQLRKTRSMPMSRPLITPTGRSRLRPCSSFS